MSVLTDRLRAYGAQMDEALERCVDDEEVYAECFSIFLSDPYFPALDKALKDGDYPAAFAAAHAIKGVAGNLGLTPMFEAACDLVEPLRRREYDGLAPLYVAVMAQKAVLDAML